MNGSNCMPASWKEDSDLFVTNIVLISLVGASGSAFTLTAVPYAAFKLGDRFHGVWEAAAVRCCWEFSMQW